MAWHVVATHFDGTAQLILEYAERAEAADEDGEEQTLVTRGLSP
ncbi:MAG: hypothetical protein ACRDPK_10770 [Carbonactinosporaceae bacterium]